MFEISNMCALIEGLGVTNYVYPFYIMNDSNSI